MKRTLWLVAVLILFLGKVSFSQVVHSRAYDMMLSSLLDHSVDEVSVDKVITDTSNILFLDAREKKEYEVSHIRGARWIGYDDFDTSRVKDIGPNQKIVVYCSVGYRSEKVTEKLESAGYNNVSNLYGGIFEWVNQNNEVVAPNDSTTQKVHAYDHIWGIWLKNGDKVFE